MDGDEKTHHTIIGPYFDWKSERARWRGLFPILWDKKDDVDCFTWCRRFFFRFADDDPLKATTVVPPFYHHRTKDETKWGLVPLVFHTQTPEDQGHHRPVRPVSSRHGAGPLSARDTCAFVRAQQEAGTLLDLADLPASARRQEHGRGGAALLPPVG